VSWTRSMIRRESVESKDGGYGRMAGRCRSRRSMASTARLEGIAKVEERKHSGFVAPGS
jgi:hypothetical protein